MPAGNRQIYALLTYVSRIAFLSLILIKCQRTMQRIKARGGVAAYLLRGTYQAVVAKLLNLLAE